jgi:hypothetical protein
MAVKELVWCVIVAGTTRAPIENVSGRGERHWPESGRNGGVEHECVHAVIQNAKNTLSTTILLRSVWASKA